MSEAADALLALARHFEFKASIEQHGEHAVAAWEHAAEAARDAAERAREKAAALDEPQAEGERPGSLRAVLEHERAIRRWRRRNGQ